MGERRSFRDAWNNPALGVRVGKWTESGAKNTHLRKILKSKDDATSHRHIRCLPRQEPLCRGGRGKGKEVAGPFQGETLVQETWTHLGRRAAGGGAEGAASLRAKQS